MIGDYDVPVVEEGVTLSPHTQAVTAWLSECFMHLEAGAEDRIPCDPFYQSNLTDEQIDKVIAALDSEYDHEWRTYPDYHRNRSGAEAGTEFHRLGPTGRRALVEGLQQINARYAAEGG